MLKYLHDKYDYVDRMLEFRKRLIERYGYRGAIKHDYKYDEHPPGYECPEGPKGSRCG
jgi:hypothetical protein